jgi:hypothetical protein
MPIDSNQILVILLAIFIVVFIFCSCMKKRVATKEGYADSFFAKDYAKGNWMSRPNFRADLSPRFDSTRVGGGQIVGDFPGMAVQAAPLTPVESLVNFSTPSYAQMGGADGAYIDPRLPAGGLSTSQVNTILSNKFGRGAGDTPDYMDPKMLLPVPDMKKTMARDPTDPNTFMYDRYLFAPLKRRYGKVGVDFIRGDIPIPQLRMGWFDPAPVAKQDLMAGYFADYLDIQQSTSLKDALFERKPTVVQEATPWARLADRTIYSLL